jgi:hypothetical protein
MVIREAKARLVSMLADGGVTPGAVTAAEVRTIVEIYRRFTAIPADDAAPAEKDGDGILAQFGTCDFRGVRAFETDLTRQFREAGDQDAPLWQLSCTLHWDASPETEALASGDLWSFGMTLDAFFTAAVALPGWAWALDSPQAVPDLVIMLEQI